MSYSKHVWEEQEFILPDKMNHIENGIYVLDENKMGSSARLTGEVKSVANKNMLYYIKNGTSGLLANIEDFNTICDNSTYFSTKVLASLIREVLYVTKNGPNAIQINSLPANMFIEGEALDYTEIGVDTYYNNTLWVDPTYNYSRLPYEKLTFNPTPSYARLQDSLNLTEVQTVTVSYNEPVLGKQLTSAFDIVVRKHPPTRIETVVAPTKTRYEDGETIDATGLQVRAYYQNEVWSAYGYIDGVIPSNEITILDTTAYVTANNFSRTQVIHYSWTEPVYGETLIGTFSIISYIDPPAEMRVVSEPTKTRYRTGQTVDFTTGLVVKYYDANGNVWTSSQYPNGIIPNNELELPTDQIATITSDEEGLNEITSQRFVYMFPGVESTNTYEIELSYTAYNPMIPRTLSIISNPYTTRYDNGEEINIAGLRLRAYDKNGDIWAEEGYTDSSNVLTGSTQITSSPTIASTNSSNIYATNTEQITIIANFDGIRGASNLTIQLPIQVHVPGPSFAELTEAQLYSVVQRLDSGALTVTDVGWKVGESRNVHLSNTSSTISGWDIKAENIKMVILDNKQAYTLTNGAKSHYVIGFTTFGDKGPLAPSSGTAFKWSNSKRRTWCNSTFKNSLPTNIKNCFKSFKNYSLKAYPNTGFDETEDTFSLFAAGNCYNSNNVSEERLAYEISNRSKVPYLEGFKLATMEPYASTNFWTRTPKDGSYSYYIGTGSNWLLPYTSGSTNYHYMSVFGCI